MDVTIQVIRFYKIGLQPLLITTSRLTAMGREKIATFVVWPEKDEEGMAVQKLISLSMPPFHEDNEEKQDALDVMRLAAQEGALHELAGLSNSTSPLLGDLALLPIELEKLRAWRSIGLYSGLHDGSVLDHTTLTFIASLDTPLNFDTRRGDQA